MPILRLSLLGPPLIEVDGRPLRLEMRKTLALLAYLSLSPQSPTRETLAAMFWPEFDQQHSMTNLRRNLFSLARSLPPGLLATDRERIGLKREDWLQIDVEEFRQQLSFVREHIHSPDLICSDCIASLEQAITIYQGDFLKGFNLKDCPEFDDWQLYWRESLRSEYASALEKLALYYQARREWEKAIRTARSWVALDRLDEDAQRMLIQLYSQSGLRAMAIRQYETLVDQLRSELGQGPDEETRSLYQSLLPAEADSPGESGPADFHFAQRKSDPLIKTKLYIPPVRVGGVARPRLFELLDAGSQRSLTLVSAPAGFGKTTLLAGWTAHTSLPIAWFSVDESDNDPVRFVAYLLAALDSVRNINISEQFQSFLQSLQPSIQSILVQLVNDLAGESEPFVLILDDYQFIHSQDVHKAVAFLIENMPACMHLVLSTRSDPPISLALLRARDQLVEIRMSELRFSPAESAGFLQQVMALQLTPEDVSALDARTEGWIAGLQIAALAVRSVASQTTREVGAMESGQAVSQFIQTFSGSNRYILDYLGEEVLNRHSEETRRFLLQTSILERLSGQLCDAVTLSRGSQTILEELEKENLFVVPLDNERRWYRYHHLFAELLLYQLDQTLSKRPEPGTEGYPVLAELHLRAAGWFEINHFFGEAVHHYMAAKEYDRAADLIEGHAKPMIFNTGQIYTLRGWLTEMPAHIFQNRPNLLIAKAWTLILEDQFAAALEQLEMVQQVIQARQDREADSLLGECALLRGALAELRTRDVVIMRTQGLLAWEKLPLDDSMLRGLAAWLVGASYLFDGDTHHAESFLLQAIRLCREAGNIFITSVAVQELSNVRMEQGRYREAYHLLQRSLHEMSSGGRCLHPSFGYIHYNISQILLAWNELEEAERQLTSGIDLVAQDVPGEVLIMTTSILPHIRLALGKRDEALRLAEECLQRVEAYPFPYIPTMVKANLIRFWIRLGDQDRIEAWFNTCGLAPGEPVHPVREIEYIALAKVLLHLGRTEGARQVLAQLRDLAESQGRNGKLVSILQLQALALNQSNDLERALDVLETSLRLAQPEKLIRPYVDEGKAMEELLKLGADRGIWKQTHLDGFVHRILKAIQQDQAHSAGSVDLQDVRQA